MGENYDAMDIALHLLGEPDELFAVHAGPRPIQPDVLAGLVAISRSQCGAPTDPPPPSSSATGAAPGSPDADPRGEGRVIVDDCTARWTPGTQCGIEPQPADAVDAGNSSPGSCNGSSIRSPSDPPGTKARVLQLCDGALGCLTGQAETVNTHSRSGSCSSCTVNDSR